MRLAVLRGRSTTTECPQFSRMYTWQSGIAPAKTLAPDTSSTWTAGKKAVTATEMGFAGRCRNPAGVQLRCATGMQTESLCAWGQAREAAWCQSHHAAGNSLVCFLTAVSMQRYRCKQTLASLHLQSPLHACSLLPPTSSLPLLPLKQILRFCLRACPQTACLFPVARTTLFADTLFFFPALACFTPHLPPSTPQPWHCPLLPLESWLPAFCSSPC